MILGLLVSLHMTSTAIDNQTVIRVRRATADRPRDARVRQTTESPRQPAAGVRHRLTTKSPTPTTTTTAIPRNHSIITESPHTSSPSTESPPDQMLTTESEFSTVAAIPIPALAPTPLWPYMCARDGNFWVCRGRYDQRCLQIPGRQPPPLVARCPVYAEDTPERLSKLCQSPTYKRCER